MTLPGLFKDSPDTDAVQPGRAPALACGPPLSVCNDSVTLVKIAFLCTVPKLCVWQECLDSLSCP